MQRFKARLVWGGIHQIKCIEYQATYAPTAHLGHVRLTVAIAAKYDIKIHQIAICTAYLGVDLEEEIYMHPPQGYIPLLQNGIRYYYPRSKTSWKMVLRLKKFLYGLKQSPHFWYGTCKDFMISIGFVASHVERGLFVLEDEGTVSAAVVLYVDDLLIIAMRAWLGRLRIR